MKTTITKITALLLTIVLSSYVAFSQQVVITASTLNVCPGTTTVAVPVTVQNFNGVASISLTLDFPLSNMTYTGYTNNSSLAGGFILVNTNGPKVLAAWFGLSPVNLANGATLFTFNFTYSCSQSPLNWDLTTQGACQISDLLGVEIPTTFVNGAANCESTPFFSVQPVDASVSNGDPVQFTATATSGNLQWQESTDGVTWTNLTNTPPYSGVTTSTLSIDAVTAGMDGYKYQAVATTTACLLTASSSAATLTVSSGCPFPLTFNTTGGGFYCQNGVGVTVGLDNSEGGVTYTLLKDGISTGLTIAGNGMALNFGSQTAAGVYTIEGTNVCGTTTMSGQAIVTVLPLPLVTLDPIGPYCVNNGLVTLSGGSPVGGTYSGFGVTAGQFDPAFSGAGVFNITYTYTDFNGCVNSASNNITIHAVPSLDFALIPQTCADGAAFELTQGSPIGGTYSGVGVSGNIFSPAVAGAGTHVITYTFTDANSCTSSITQNAVVGAVPDLFTVTGGGVYCTGGSGVQIGLDGSQNGPVYSLYFDGAVVANEIGTGSPINFGFFPGVGFYSVIADWNGCTATMTGSATISTLAGPQAFLVAGNGNYCTGTSGVEVTLSGSESGVSYELYLDGIATGTILTGTGSALSFGNQTAGLYVVYATNTCGTIMMDGSATIIADPYPVAYAVTGGGNFCVGQSGVVVGLDDTELNATYELFLDGVTTGNITSGTGDAISFGLVTAGGNYTIVATNSCGTTNMDGSALVTVNPLPVGYLLSGGGNVCPGTGGLTLTLSGSETGFTYTSYLNGLENTDVLAGTGSALSFGPYTEAGIYSIYAQNTTTGCAAWMLNNEIITTGIALIVTQNPSDVSVSEGGNASFTASGNVADVYTWQVSTDGGMSFTDLTETAPYSGVATTTLQIAAVPYSMNGYEFRLKMVDNDCAQEVFSAEVVLSVNQTPTINLYAPVIVNAVPGQVVVPVTFENLANVASFSLTLNYDAGIMSYTGYQNLNPGLSAGMLLLNGIGNQVKFAWFDVTPITLANGTLVEYLFDYTGGNGLFSWSTTPGDNSFTNFNAATLASTFTDGSISGCTNPTAFTVSGGGNLCAGQNAFIELSNSQIGVDYNVYINGTTWSLSTPGTGAALSIGPYNAAGVYTIQATVDNCATWMTGSATVTINPVLSVTSNPSDVTTADGDNAVFTATADNATGYQWQVSTDGGNSFANLTDGVLYSGVTTNQLSITGAVYAMSGYQYRCQFTESVCAQEVFSNAATLNVTQALVINTIAPVITNAVPGQVIVPITIENFANVASLSLTFNYDLSIMNYTGYQNLNPSFMAGIMDLNGIGNQVKFAWFDVTPLTLANGVLVEYVFNYTGGDGLFTWSTVPGDNSYTDFNANILPAIFTNGSIEGCDLPVVQTIDGGGTQCIGGSGFPIGLSGSEVGATYTLYLNGVSTFQTLAGTGGALDYGIQTAPGTYTVVATNFCGTIDMAGTATISYNALPTVFTVGGGGNICPGANAAITLSGSETDVLYFINIDGVNAFVESGTGSALSFNQSTAGVYTIEATNLVTGCQRTMSSSATIAILPGLNVTLNPVDVTIFEGGTASFSAMGDIATAYQWQISTDGGFNYTNLTETAPYSGVTSMQLTITGAPYALNGALYRCQITESVCNPEVFTTPALLTVNQSLVINLIAPVITGALPGQVIVPVTVQNMSNVAAISLSMEYNTAIMSYTGYQNVNPALAAGSLVVNGIGNEAKMAWFAIAPVSISNDILIEFVFNYTGGSGLFTWSTAPGQNQFTDYNATILAANFVPGSIDGGCPLPAAFMVHGGGTYCTGGAGMEITMDTTDLGVNYTLYYNGIATPTVVAGTGSAISFGTFTSAGTYTVVATNVCGNTDMLNSVSISIDPLPAVYAVVGGGSYCPGTGGVTVALMNSEIGTIYELFLDGVTTGLTFSGDGTMLYFGSQTAAGVYTVTATNNCGTVAMSSSATITLDPLPFAYDVTGGGTYCIGGAGVEVGLSGSEADATYTLYNNGMGTGMVLNGTGFAISFGLQAAAGVYTVEATNLCGTYTMNASATVSIDPLPVAFQVTGGGSYCVGGTGVAIHLNGSETGTTYELFFNGAATGIVAIGDGNALSFGLQTTAGTYTVWATNLCGTVQMDASAAISIDPLPLLFNVTGGGNYCTGGSGVTVGLDGSETGTNYTLYYNGVTTGIALSGDGSPLSFGLVTSAGTYTVYGTNACGTVMMTGNAIVVINPLPVAFDVSGGGQYCTGGAGLSVDLSGSETDATYELFLNGLTTGSVLSGTGTALSFGLQASAGTYTIVATNLCGTIAMNGNATIIIDPLPVAFQVTGGGAYCVGGIGVAINLNGSETGTTYELFFNGAATGVVAIGDGNALSFGAQTAAGTYTVWATNHCGTVQMDASATVSINPLPLVFNVTGGGSYCVGGAGVAVSLDGSESGITYTLLLNGISTGTSLSGDGNALTFGALTAAGTYTVQAANACGTVVMTGSAVVVVNPLPVVFTVTGGGSYCAGGAGLSVDLSGTEADATYELFINGLSTGSVLTGTGSALSFGLQTSAGIYTVVATNACGNSNMTGNAVISINNTPSSFNVSGGGSYCVGGIGADITLSGSESDASYELYLGGLPTGYVLSGTGAPLSFTSITATGVFTIVAANGCGTTLMTGSAVISTDPLPGIFNIIGGGAFCPGGSGVNIGIDGSETGVNYTLYLNGVSPVVNVSGNGTGFSFGVFTAPGTYTIVASNSCGTQNMNGTATVAIGSTLTIYSVTGGGTYIAGGQGLPIGLSGSQLNVNYELFINGAPTGIVQAGTGAALDFGNQQTAGTYTIMAVDPYSNCISMMTGAASIFITPIIITNPLSVSIYEGYNASFSVTALGATIYQWQVSTDGGMTFANITPSIYYSGINSNTLFITGAPLSWNGNMYQCVVSNPGSPLVFSNAATLLVVNVPAVVTIAPTMTSPAGSNIVVPINVLNFNNIAAMAWTLNYDPAMLTYVGYQNAHAALAPGMMFYVNDVTGTFLLQWFSMTPANIGNNTVIELLFDYNCGYSPLVWETYPPEACQYGNILANPVPATWVNGSINCSTGLVISDQPDNYTTCEGGTATFTIATTPAASTYQWMVSTDFGATWMDLFASPLYSGVNTATLTVTGAVSSMSNFLYACKVNSGMANAAVSNPASVILVPFVNATGTIVASPASIICPGTPVTFSVTSAYPFTGATYNWLINGIDVGTGLTYTTSGLVNGDVVDVDIIDPTNCVIASVTPITMIVDPHPVITSNPVDVIAVVGDVVTFSVTATGASTYQWQESTDGGFTFANIFDGGIYSGTATSVLTISGVTLPMDQFRYRCVVTESLCGNSVTSLPAKLNVFTAPIYTYLPNVANCTGYQVVIPVTVDNFIQVASASLKFNFDPSVLSYVNYQNVNPALTGSPSNLLAISNTGSQINFFWFGPLASATIPNGGILFEIVFNYATPGTTNLSWDLGAGNTQYTNLAALNIPAFFIDGSATSYPLPIVYDMTGGGEYCIGGVGVDVGVSGSEVGVNYELFLNGVTTGNIVAGTGSAISFGNQLLAGTYTVVATNVTTLCFNSMNNVSTVIINPLPIVTWTNILEDVCEEIVALELTGGMPLGGTYSGPGVSNNQFNAAIAGPGPHTLTYTYMDANGCVNSATNTITVIDGPTPFPISGGGTFCQGEIGVLVGLTDSEPVIVYQLFINGINSGSPIFGTGGVLNFGYQTVPGVYTVVGLNIFTGCVQLMIGSVTVTEIVPNVTWPTPFANVCENSSPFALSGGIPAGGTYSGNGVINNVFDPSIAGNGVHTLTYTYTDTYGCTGSATNTIAVVPGTDVTFSPLPDVCVNGTSFDLSTFVTPIGGTFSGTGVSGTTFNPSVAGVGTHTITYSFAANNCTVTITRNISVLALPALTWANVLAPQCETETAYLLTGATPAGGVYSGTAVAGGVFNPSLAGVGTFTLLYTYTDGAGCTNSITNTITVNPLPVVTWPSVLPDQCVTSTTFALSGGLPAGGVYSGPGVSGNNFNAVLAGIGLHTITYTFTDANGCVNEITNTISVVPVPVVTMASLPDVCVNGGSILLTSYVGPVGGVFSGTGVTGNSFDPAVAGVGVHVITYTYTAGTCVVAVSKNITVLPAPVVTWANALTSQCEDASAYFLSGGTPAGGVYSGTGVTGNIFNASLAGAGIHTLTYTFTDANGCTASATNTITVNALPTVTWSTALTTQCESATVYALSGGSPAGGVYSGAGVSGTNFNANLAGVGIHTLTYTYTDANGCTNEVTNTITVVTVPVVTFTSLPDVCVNGGSILLTSYVSPVGGVFSGSGVSGTSFNPAVAGVGVHTITYSYTANGCTVSVDKNITVTPAPVVSWTNVLTSQCETETSYFLTGGTPAGGVYSGIGVTGNIFNASLAGAGTHTLTYTFTDANGCSSTATNTITVNALPTVTWTTALATQCESATVYALTGGSPAGGVYSGAGVSGTNFNANLAGVGIHTLTYTYTDANGCTNEVTNTITVVTEPVVTFSPLPDVCVNAGSLNLNSFVVPVGGVFTGTGVTGNSFDPFTAGVGTHVITYSVTVNGCTVSVSRNIIVTPAPVVSWTNVLTSQCITETSYFLTGGTPAGGVYSGTGVTGNIFNASLAGAGTHTLTYTFTDANGCSSTATNTITVNALPNVTWTTALTTQCESATVYALTGGSPAGGVYSGAGVSGTNFNANLAGVGIHTLTYTFTDANGCTNEVTNTITVVTEPFVTFSPLPDVCVNAGSLSLTSYVVPVGGVFTGTGVTGSNFDPSVAGIGTHVITYSVTLNGCTVSVSRNITVTPAPVVSWTNVLTSQCVSSDSYFLTGGTPAGGVYSGPGVNGTVFNASLAGIGTHTLSYTYTAANGCSAVATNTITVTALPVVTWASSLPNQCITATSFTLSGGLPAGGTYSGPGVSGTNFNASILGVGTYILTYTYTDGNGCTDFVTNTITVNPLPVISFSALPDVCDNVSTILLTSYASPVGGVFSGAGVVGNTFQPGIAGAGTHTITYTYTDPNGCIASATRTITVIAAPVVSWTTVLAPQCVTATSYFLTGASPVGGFYSGAGVTGNIFNASLAGVGSHVITYTYTNAAGCTASVTNTIVVNALPVVTLAAFADVCVSSSPFALSGGLPLGGTYSGTGVSGSNFNPTLAGIGLHTITYTFTDPATGCTNSATSTISVVPVPVITFSPLPTVCANAASIDLSLYVIPVGGVFTGTGVTGSTFNPATAGVGVHTISYTVTVNGCSTTASRNIAVVAAPVVTWSNALTAQCVVSTSYFLSGASPAGGVYSGPGVSGNIFNASLAGAGTHTLTYTYTNANGCTSTATNTIVVYTEPTVTWTLPATTFCVSSTTFALTGGTPTPGTYSGPGVSGTNFSAALAGVGIHTITYSYVDVNGCGNSVSNTITVTPSPVATFFPLPSVCIDGGVVVLSNYGVPVGGVFTGTGVTGNTFNPVTAGVGTHTITYTVTNGFGCTASATSTITVLAAPVVTWTPTPLAPRCIDAAPVSLTGGLPTGGVYSGPGVINGVFYPAVAGAGTFTLTYSYTNANGCSNSVNNTITVNPLPIVSWTNALTSQCLTSTTYNLAATGATPAGGVFAGAGVIGNNFNASLAGTGTHVLTYTYTNANGCTASISNVIIVYPALTVTFPGVLGPLCVNSTTFALTTGVPAGGTYSGLGVSGNNFNASVAGVGTHTITYSYTNLNGCSGSATNTITVNALPVVAWTTVLPTQCANVTNLSLTGATPPGGTYSGPGVIGSSFNPSMAGPGTHTLTYTFTNANGCTNSATNTIVVSAMPTVNLGPDQSICYGDSTTLIPTTIPAAGLTYLWSTGETTPTITVVVVDDATYCVTVTNAFGCTAVDCVDVLFLPLPIANAGANQTVCFGEFATFTATGGEGPNAYLWSTGSTSQVITVTANDTTVYYVTVTNLAGCTDVGQVTLNVNPLPTVTLGPDQSICENMSVTLIPTGGPLQPFSNYLWNTGLENQPLVADSTGYGLNNPTTFVVTVTLNGCANKDEVVITWVPCPGIDEISKEEIITVYPNPTNGEFTVTIENVDNALTLDVYNNIGQHLITQKLTNNGVSKYTRTFDLSSYPTGIYFLRFADGDKVRSKKLIVK